APPRIPARPGGSRPADARGVGRGSPTDAPPVWLHPRRRDRAPSHSMAGAAAVSLAGRYSPGSGIEPMALAIGPRRRRARESLVTDSAVGSGCARRALSVARDL